MNTSLQTVMRYQLNPGGQRRFGPNALRPTSIRMEGWSCVESCIRMQDLSWGHHQPVAPFGLGVLKIKAKCGELMPDHQGRKLPTSDVGGFHYNTVAACRKLAARVGRASGSAWVRINIRTGEPYSHVHVHRTVTAHKCYFNVTPRSRFRDAYNEIANASKPHVSAVCAP